MNTKTIDPRDIQPGMILCGDDGKPFAEVLSAKVNRNGGVRVLTPFLPVSYPKGSMAVVSIPKAPQR